MAYGFSMTYGSSMAYGFSMTYGSSMAYGFSVEGVYLSRKTLEEGGWADNGVCDIVLSCDGFPQLQLSALKSDACVRHLKSSELSD